MKYSVRSLKYLHFCKSEVNNRLQLTSNFDHLRAPTQALTYDASEKRRFTTYFVIRNFQQHLPFQRQIPSLRVITLPVGKHSYSTSHVKRAVHRQPGDRSRTRRVPTYPKAYLIIPTHFSAHRTNPFLLSELLKYRESKISIFLKFRIGYIFSSSGAF